MMVVSTENRGSVPCLPNDAVVEVSALISASGAEPLAWGDMKPHERGWLQLMKAMEETVIEAALTGDYGLAREAFNINPLVENGDNAIKVLHELFVAHEKYLPQFAECIKTLKAQGLKPSDETVCKLLAEGK
jgi:6-phospho-beta-glucosidase